MIISISDFITNTELKNFKVNFVDFGEKKFEFKISIRPNLFKKNVSSPIVLENGGSITAKFYITFEARYFLPKENLWYTHDYKNLECIDEINEKSYDNGILRLAGFGKKTRYWTEYLIENGEIEINLND